MVRSESGAYRNGSARYVLEGHSDGVVSVQTLPGNRALSHSLDGTIRIWNLAYGSCERVLEGHEEAVRTVLRPDTYPDIGDRLFSGGEDGTVRMWDVSSGRCLAIGNAHTAPVIALLSLAKAAWFRFPRIIRCEFGACKPACCCGHSRGTPTRSRPPLSSTIRRLSLDPTIKPCEFGILRQERHCMSFSATALGYRPFEF